MMLTSSASVHLLLASVVLLLAIAAVIRGHETPSSGNILVIPYDGAESHFLVARSISKELAKRGHKVTFLLHEKHQDNFMKHEDAYLFYYEYYKQQVTYDRHDEFYMNMTKAGEHPFTNDRSTYRMWLANLTYTPYYNNIANQCNQMMLDNELMTRLKAQNFEIVLVDSITVCRMPQYLKRPVAAFSALPLISPYSLYDPGLLTGDPSYYPAFIDALDRSYSLFYRVRCTISVIYDYWRQWYDEESYLNIQFRFFSAYAQTKAIHKFSDADINLINSHYVLDYQRSLANNTFAVGGLTTRPKQALSQEWEDFLKDGDAVGVILFTYIQSIDDDTAAIFVQAFKTITQKFKVKVIWQLKGTSPPDIPENVKVVEWIPQNDLLGHPKMMLFVSQGGTNSIYEAIYHGVPMVLVPVYGDQHFNAMKVANRGIGLVVTKVKPHLIAEAIMRVFYQLPRYKKAADQLSAIFRESPRPTDVAADWIEYAIRNGGTKHLEPISDWELLQYLPRDVFVTLAVFNITLFIISVLGGWVFFKGYLRQWISRNDKSRKSV
ncbi:UDP-glucuronosyltransferase 2B31-like [Amphiura filiformis]|uniref:UDP-glucuronosyltransferase 2B31-like n=1 Tax=Amphiura filiformis TaxID=82378 RepID=UPI003B226898